MVFSTLCGSNIPTMHGQFQVANTASLIVVLERDKQLALASQYELLQHATGNEHDKSFTPVWEFESRKTCGLFLGLNQKIYERN